MTSGTERAAVGFAVTTTLLLVTAMPMMAFAPLSPALPAISDHFAHVPNIDYLSRFVLTLPAIFIAILAPFAGAFVDRFGRKRLLIGSMALYGVVGVSGGALDSLTALLASRAVMGIAIAGIMTSSTTLLGDYFSGRARQRIMGLRGAFVNYSAVLINALGGLVASFNWRASFLIFLVAFVLLPIAVRILYEPAAEGHSPAQADSGAAQGALPRTAATPALFLAFGFAITIAYSAAFFMVPVQVPFYLRELGSDSPLVAGLAIATSAFAVATASLFYARIRSRFSAEAVMAAGFGLAAVGYALVAAAGTPAQIYGSVVVSGSGIGLLMANVVVWILDKSPAHIRGRVVGGITTSTFVGQFASPLLSQPIANAFSLSTAYAVAAAGMAVIGAGFVLYLALRRLSSDAALR